MKSIEINNSQDSAIKSGKWKNPGASLYDNIMDSDNWSDCLEETYLIAPIKDINNSVDSRTPYSRSGCKYPHHEIKNNRLVLNVAGVKAAYARAKQQGVYSGELKDHLDKHIKELGMLNKDGKYFEDTIENNFFDIEMYLQEKTDYHFIEDLIQSDYVGEASHGKLKFDFRAGFDYDTGHALKIVYSLNNIKIHDIGDGFIDYDDPNRQNVIDDIQKNITKKGNLDHKSSGQKVLAIIDRVTGKNIKEANVVGIHAPGIGADATKLSIDPKELQRKYVSTRYIRHLKVGEIEKLSSFKTTKWMKGDTTKKIMDDGSISTVDNTIGRRQSGELLKYGRGAKMNDLIPNNVLSYNAKVAYNHPSKKDIRRNPELYNKESVAESYIQKYYGFNSKGIRIPVGSESVNIMKESSNKLIDDESIKTPEELLSWMNFIGYGWTSIKDNRVYGIGEDDDGEDFYKYYRLQSPQETIDRKYGVCWDQVEVERVWFEHKKIPYDIYYIDHETTTHTFLVFKRNGKYYWFEHSWYTYRGIHEYDSLDVLLEDIRQKHYSTIADENKPHTLIYTRIGLPKYGITCQKYVNWARSQPSVIKDTPVQIQESLDWIDRFVNDESFRESCDDRSDSMNWNFFFEDTDDDTDELSDENEENENTEGINKKDHTKKDEKDLMDEPIDEPPSLDDSEDNNEESKDSQEKSSEEDDKTKEKEEPSESKPLSMPKKVDAVESDKNGVRRKNLYVAFIEWCKKYNNKNAFGSVFDKDAFHVSYPFVPHEMRYFYRLANPMLCVLSGNLTFFALSELKKINSSNKKLDEVIIFAATEKDYRVFCINDKKVYLAHEGENGEVLLDRALANSFDLYIQNMIGQGDILNAPIEKKEPAKTETPIEDDTSTSEEN